MKISNFLLVNIVILVFSLSSNLLCMDNESNLSLRKHISKNNVIYLLLLDLAKDLSSTIEYGMSIHNDLDEDKKNELEALLREKQKTILEAIKYYRHAENNLNTHKNIEIKTSLRDNEKIKTDIINNIRNTQNSML